MTPPTDPAHRHPGKPDTEDRSCLPLVLFVAVPAAIGGSNRSLATLLESLEGKVERALAAPMEGTFGELVRSRRLADHVIATPRQHGLGRLARPLSAIRIFRWAFAHRTRLAAIHANALTGLNLAAPTSIALQLPVVTWVHDPVGSRWGSLLGPVLNRTIKDLRLVGVSATALEVAARNGLRGSNPTCIIPNPISPRDVVGVREHNKSRRVTVGVLGGSTHRKGFDLLPEVMSKSAHLPIDWLLYVGLQPGVGEETAAEIDVLPDVSVRIFPKTPDVASAYAKCDVVLIPSRNESFCRIAAEAMLNAIPVVGSDIEPLRTLVGDDAGLLFPVEDTTAAAIAIEKMVVDPDMRQEMGRVGHIRAARLKPDVVAASMLNAYGL